MLPPFIIEQIRQREERERRQREESRPRLELPLERYPGPRRPAGQTPPVDQEDEPNRGVIILDIA